MTRFFNTAGPINPRNHYSLDPLQRINRDSVMTLIEQNKYFILHAPRQTGKTSSLLALRDYLNRGERFTCLYVNVESAQTARSRVSEGMQTIVMRHALEIRDALGDAGFLSVAATSLQRSGPNGALEDFLTEWCRTSSKPCVLLIDEIDALVGDTLIGVLRQIRSGYVKRPDAFPQSIILCGVRDIRDYRIKQEGEQIITGGSAFNIKAESLRLGDFCEDDVVSLLEQHTGETGQQFDKAALQRIWYLTRGQPWLVNALAYETCFRMKENLDRSRAITATMVDEAKEALIQRRETHLDQLSDKLREERVRRIIEPLLEGSLEPEHVPVDDILYTEDLGLIHSKPSVGISNPIYREVIPRELTFSAQRTITQESLWYSEQSTGRLVCGKLVAAFQQFFCENSEAWIERFDYREAGPQLLMQAFLQRVINSGGSIEREYGLGRGRTDLFIRWPLSDGIVQTFVVEMKILHKSLEKTLSDGLVQTAGYADTCGAEEAHLIIFDRTPGKTWDEKIWHRVERHGERTIEVWGM